MAKLIKFPLEMADGTKARSIEELREHADVASIAAYYENGKLYRWLLANYLDEDAKKIEAIKESLKSEFDKINTQKIKQIYEALGLTNLDEKQLFNFLQAGIPEDSSQGNDFSFEVEDDPAQKNEVAKYIHPDINLEDWNIAVSETEVPDIYQVCIENKKEDIFSSFKLKKDSKFYVRIATAIYNILESLTGRAEDQKIKALTDSIFKQDVMKVVSFGKLLWRVIKKDKNQVLLLCTKPVVKKHLNEVQSFLEEEFFNNFTEQEKEFLIPLNNSNFGEKMIGFSIGASLTSITNEGKVSKVFLLSKELVGNLVPRDAREQDINWWLSDGYVRADGGVRDNYSSKDEFGVIPAIVVSREGVKS